jgi:hypothetical protein
VQLSPASCHFIPLRSKYSPQHPVLKHVLTCVQRDYEATHPWKGRHANRITREKLFHNNEKKCKQKKKSALDLVR